MGIHNCLACYNNILSFKDDQFCLHQREVLKNPYFHNREHYRKLDDINNLFFQQLQNYSIPNIL